MNLALGGVAMNIAVKDLAVKQGFIKEGQKLTWGVYRKIFSLTNLKTIKNELGHAGFFTLNAFAFQFVVRPYLNAGNPIPLGFWLAVNIPAVYKYFARNSKQTSEQAIETARTIQDHALKKLRDQTLTPDKQYESSPFDDFIEKIETIQEGQNTVSFRKLKKSLKGVQAQLNQSNTFRNEVNRALGTMGGEEIAHLMRLAGVETEVGNQISKREAIKSITKLLAGIAGVVMLSAIIDSGVSDLPEAIPELDKSTAGFVIMAFFSSIGELMTTTKFFQAAQMQSGTQNISDSNAINLLLGKLAIASSFFKNGFEFKTVDED